MFATQSTLRSLFNYMKYRYILFPLLISILFSGACSFIKRERPSAVPAAKPPAIQKIPPSELYYHILVAELYQADRDWEQAINEYKSALQYDAESPYLAVQIATLYLMQNNPDEAIKWCNKAIAIDSRYLEAHLLLAGIYASQNNNPEAIKQYEAILAIDPLQQDAYLYLGSLYSESNEPQKAIDTLQRLLKINPESSMAHFYLGNVYMGLKNYVEAEKHYTKALDINPDFDVDIYYLEYNKASYCRAFLGFKENILKNSLVPYLRFYRKGVLTKDTNYINQDKFIRLVSE